MTEEGASDWLNPELLNRIVAHQLELKSRLSETGARATCATNSETGCCKALNEITKGIPTGKHCSA